MRRPFKIIDVFSETPFRGNPLAVVYDAEGLTDEQMLGITRWMNLSETTFLVPPTNPEADYRVRIFVPFGEIPFAGHPTIGTCHAWLEAGGKPRAPGVVVQECGAGLVRLKGEKGDFAFTAPPLTRYGPVDGPTRKAMARALRIQEGDIVDAAWVDNGPGWVAAMLRDAEAVLRLQPVLDNELRTVGAVGRYGDGSPWQYEVRAFFSNGSQTVEDPVTGSLNASLAQWFFDSGRAKGSYVVRQGTALGREGRVQLSQDETGQVWVGGRATTLVEGQIEA